MKLILASNWVRVTLLNIAGQNNDTASSKTYPHLNFKLMWTLYHLLPANDRAIECLDTLSNPHCNTLPNLDGELSVKSLSKYCNFMKLSEPSQSMMIFKVSESNEIFSDFKVEIFQKIMQYQKFFSLGLKELSKSNLKNNNWNAYKISQDLLMIGLPSVSLSLLKNLEAKVEAYFLNFRLNLIAPTTG